MTAIVPSLLTYCSVDDGLLRVWGIVDRERYELIDHILTMSRDRLAEGTGRPELVTELAEGEVVLVKHGLQFKRGSIIRQEPDTKTFQVRFIDVGNIGTVSMDDIRLTSAAPHLRVLDDSPCVQDYILGDALIKPHAWLIEDMELLNLTLQDHSEVQLLDTVAGKTLITWSVNDSTTPVPFYSLLVQRGVADYITLDSIKAAVTRKHSTFSQLPIVSQPRIHQPIRVRHPYAFSDLTPQLMISSPATNHQPMLSAPGLGLHPRLPQPTVAPQPTNSALQFKVERLPVGTQHEVHVCHVIEGTQSFMIQLKENLENGRLQKLMARLNDTNIRHEPIELSFVGLTCLGRCSMGGLLCRAVVSTVLPDAANLLFVDFGKTETVPFSEIYKLPEQFLEEPVMALQFTLAHLSTDPVLLTRKGHKIFEKLALNADCLVLCVTKPEIQSKQYCDLYVCDDKGVRIDMKLMMLSETELMKPVEYEKLLFNQNSLKDVMVINIESPCKFHVLIQDNRDLLDTFVASLQEYCDTWAMKDFLNIEEVHDNMAVCCRYGANLKWQRGLIVEEPTEDGSVVVFLVDYGWKETIPMQAVECRLNIDADFALKKKVVDTFVRVTQCSYYRMKVIAVLPANVLLVDLFDEQNRNVKDILQRKLGLAKPLVGPADDPNSAPEMYFSQSCRKRSAGSLCE